MSAKNEKIKELIAFSYRWELIRLLEYCRKTTELYTRGIQNSIIQVVGGIIILVASIIIFPGEEMQVVRGLVFLAVIVCLIILIYRLYKKSKISTKDYVCPNSSCNKKFKLLHDVTKYICNNCFTVFHIDHPSKLVLLDCPGCGVKMNINKDFGDFICNNCGANTTIKNGTWKYKDPVKKCSHCKKEINSLQNFCGNCQTIFSIPDEIPYFNELPLLYFKVKETDFVMPSIENEGFEAILYYLSLDSMGTFLNAKARISYIANHFNKNDNKFFESYEQLKHPDLIIAQCSEAAQEEKIVSNVIETIKSADNMHATYLDWLKKNNVTTVDPNAVLTLYLEERNKLIKKLRNQNKIPDNELIDVKIKGMRYYQNTNKFANPECFNEAISLLRIDIK